MDKVYVSALDDYNIDKLVDTVNKQFSELGFTLKKGSKVVIKPNLVIASHPDEAIITHPNVVAAVALWAKKQGANVRIAESPGGLYTTSAIKKIFSICKYTEMAKKYDIELYTECEYEKTSFLDGQICKSFNIVKPFLEADYIIDIAKLKSHGMLTYSGAVKNMFGTVPGLMKPEFHMRYPDVTDFSTMIADLSLCVKPYISVIDAIVAMEGDGPTGGRPKHIGALISSNNCYAADVVGCALASIKYDNLPLFRGAISRKICPASIDEIDLLGDNYEKFIKKDFLMPKSKSIDFIDRLPKFIRPLGKKITTPFPKIKLTKCIGCAKCAQSCPAKTIKIINKKAIIDKSKCISCFCCHEMCPEHVIDIKRFSLFNL